MNCKKLLAMNIPAIQVVRILRSVSGETVTRRHVKKARAGHVKLSISDSSCDWSSLGDGDAILEMEKTNDKKAADGKVEKQLDLVCIRLLRMLAAYAVSGEDEGIIGLIQLKSKLETALDRRLTGKREDAIQVGLSEWRETRAKS